jgi:histidinol dehydrogenase
VLVNVADMPDPVLEPEVKAAFDMAFDNITKFHEAQRDLGEVDVVGRCLLTPC